MIFTMSNLEERIKEGRPPSYRETIMSMATKIDDTHWEIKPPTAIELAINYGKAIAKWTAAGFPTVDDATFCRRMGMQGCGDCEWATKDAVSGEVTCTHPKCGCPAAKKGFLSTETCPIQRPGWAMLAYDAK